MYIKIYVIAASNKQIKAISNQNYILFSVLTADNMFNFTYTPHENVLQETVLEKGYT